jgi:hypothetical protein
MVPSSGFFASPGLFAPASCGKTVPLVCGRFHVRNGKASFPFRMSGMMNDNGEQNAIARVVQALERVVPGSGKQMQQTVAAIAREMVKRKVDDQELVGLVVQVCVCVVRGITAFFF